MIEALWSLEFSSNLQMSGAGVVVFETGRIFGGDSSYFYIGNYKVESGTIEGIVEIKKYGANSNALSVLGEGDKKIKLQGKVNHDLMMLKGHRLDEPSITISVTCERIADLP